MWARSETALFLKSLLTSESELNQKLRQQLFNKIIAPSFDIRLMSVDSVTPELKKLSPFIKNYYSIFGLSFPAKVPLEQELLANWLRNPDDFFYRAVFEIHLINKIWTIREDAWWQRSTLKFRYSHHLSYQDDKGKVNKYSILNFASLISAFEDDQQIFISILDDIKTNFPTFFDEFIYNLFITATIRSKLCFDWLNEKYSETINNYSPTLQILTTPEITSSDNVLMGMIYAILQQQGGYFIEKLFRLSPEIKKRVKALTCNGEFSDMTTTYQGIGQKIASINYELAIEWVQAQPEYSSTLPIYIQKQLGRETKHIPRMLQSIHLSNDDQQLSRQAEALYLACIIKKGLQIASAQKTPIFDIQGQVIVEVALDANDISGLLRSLGLEDKSKLFERIGYTPTEMTFCKLDIRQHQTLLERFKQNLAGPGSTLELQGTINNLITSPSCSSIISLQEEVMLHTFLYLETIKKHVKKVCQFPRKDVVMQEINLEIMTIFREVLTKFPSKDHLLDIEKINQALDKYRKEASTNAIKILVDAIKIDAFDEGYEVDWLEVNLKQQDFAATVATSNDYLCTSGETLGFYTGTTETAHNKRLGAQNQAFRLVTRYILRQGLVIPHANDNQEARIPSLPTAVFDVHDVVEKFSYNSTLLRKRNPTYSGPIIYNLLTSLYGCHLTNLLDSKNKQTPSAECILKAMHQFNTSNLEGDRQVIYVLNIPVNKHGKALSLNSDNHTIAEASLMAEIALMATIYRYVNYFPWFIAKEISTYYETIYLSYAVFLVNHKGELLFSSPDGKNIIKNIASLRKLYTLYPTQQVFQQTNDLTTLCSYVLFSLLMQGQHFDLKFGMLIQALAVFIQPLSLVGCKSANERYQCVSGRVDVLHEINASELPILKEVKNKLMNAMTAYLNGSGSIEAIQTILDNAYNEYRLQGAVTNVSLIDQGGPSKILPQVGDFRDVNTNRAESALPYLIADNAKNMQSSKMCLFFQAETAPPHRLHRHNGVSGTEMRDKASPSSTTQPNQ